MQYLCEAKDFGHKWDKTRPNFVKTESLGLWKTLLNTVNFCLSSGQSLINFWPFSWYEWKLTKLILYLTVFQAILTIVYLNLLDFYRILLCTLLTFSFAFGAFESWLQNFVLIWTDSKFWSFELGSVES